MATVKRRISRNIENVNLGKRGATKYGYAFTWLKKGGKTFAKRRKESHEALRYPNPGNKKPLGTPDNPIIVGPVKDDAKKDDLVARGATNSVSAEDSSVTDDYHHVTLKYETKKTETAEAASVVDDKPAEKQQ